MNCKQCGFPLSREDQFCKNCGATVNAQNEQMNNMTQRNIQSNMMNMNNNQQLGQSSYNPNINPIPNNYNQTSNYQNNSNSNNITKYIIIGVIIVVAFVGGIFLSKSFNSGSNSVLSSSSYKVTFKGFTFSIPDSYIYYEQGESLYFSDENGNWITELAIGEGSYSQLKQKKSQIPSIMQQQGFTCSTTSIKTLGGVEYITMEISSSSGEKGIMGFTKANSMKYIALYSINRDNTFDYTLLEKMSPIVSNLKTGNATNSISTKTTINFSKFNEVAK